MKFREPLVITVVGKAFFDVGHAPADHSNRRTDLQGYAAREIHPVMKLTAHQSPPAIQCDKGNNLLIVQNRLRCGMFSWNCAPTFDTRNGCAACDWF